jgi:DNA-binding beta-propeller fold protein YncE
MKKVLVIAAVTALAAVAWAAWVYEGQWGTPGSGNGQFDKAWGIAVSPLNGYVYVTDRNNHRVQVFTETGSYLRQWGRRGEGNGEFWLPSGVAVAPNGNVYVEDGTGRIQYFTRTGSFLGKWAASGAVAVGPTGYVYVVNFGNHRVQYFTATGSLLGWWGARGEMEGYFKYPEGIAVAPNGNVYVADTANYRIQYFTPNGSYLGQWGRRPEFDHLYAVDVGPDFKVFVVDVTDYRRNPYRAQVQYFTPTGTHLGEWGPYGNGPGQFHLPWDIALSRTGARAYVTDAKLNRVQYFNRNKPIVTPTSLGRVKALFK